MFNSQTWRRVPTIPRPVRSRQVDPWDMMASQPGTPVSGRLCLKTQGEWFLRTSSKGYLWPPQMEMQPDLETAPIPGIGQGGREGRGELRFSG